MIQCTSCNMKVEDGTCSRCESSLIAEYLGCIAELEQALEVSTRIKCGQEDYAIALQGAIETHCRGEEVTSKELLKMCPHHAKKLNEKRQRDKEDWART